MPFGTLSDEVYRAIIKPGLEGEGYEARRADTSLDQRSIVRDIVEGIQNADLIVADMTGRNANVFYELGLAHGLRRNVILLAQSSSDIPFDLGAYRTIIYGVPQFARPPQLVDRLSNELGQVLAAAKSGSLQFGSPLLDFGRPDGLAPLSPDGDESPGYLDALADFIPTTESFSEVMTEFGQMTEYLTSRQQAVLERYGGKPDGDIKDALIFANQLGKVWDDAAGPMEALVEDRLIPLQVKIEQGVTAFVGLGALGGGPNPAVASVVGIGTSALDLATTFEETVALIRGLRAVSSSLRAPADRLGSVMGRVSGLARRIAVVCDEAVAGQPV